MEALKTTLYALCTITCLACTILLVRQFLVTRSRLLLWSALCFVCLSINNLLLFADLALFPAMDLRLYRHLAALTGMVFLLYAFIREAD
jgi:hypothetical protein